MSCYTVSNCILENIDLNKTYRCLTEILYVFTQESNPYKVALDNSNKIMNIYEKIGNKNHFIANWLEIMSHDLNKYFEYINVETNNAQNDEEVFIMVCAATKNQQKLFVYSHQGWKHYTYTAANMINYNSISIQVFDRDEAVHELNPKISTTINANHAIVAAGGSTIQHTSNTTKGK